MKEARFPRIKTLAAFDFDAAPNIPPATIATLADGSWIDRGEPVVLLGDSGTGKTHLLIALGVAACEQGRSVRYLTAAQLGNELFQVLTEREERASVAVASNAPFSEWTSTFTDPRLASAVVDRLTFNAHIIQTGSDSYRLRSTRKTRKPRHPA
jgi:DNA replication protein DnaC